MPSVGSGKGLASVFQALGADTYALDLVIKATWEGDVLLIKLSVPPFEAEQILSSNGAHSYPKHSHLNFTVASPLLLSSFL